jgi:MerR family mercuric resistance operon transcriptional regulator
MEQREFRIGELATLVGVSVDALRYYERLKLLPRARRTSGNFRVFAPESVKRVEFIKHAQELGLTLDEVKALLATGGAEECRKVHDLLTEKLHQLDGRLALMKKFRQVLMTHLAECERELNNRGDDACCPVLSLSNTDSNPTKGTKRKKA